MPAAVDMPAPTSTITLDGAILFSRNNSAIPSKVKLEIIAALSLLPADIIWTIKAFVRSLSNVHYRELTQSIGLTHFLGGS